MTLRTEYDAWQELYEMYVWIRFDSTLYRPQRKFWLRRP
jgi:hypothetical protein